MTPVGFTAEGGAFVAWTAAVGTAVGAADPGVAESAVAGTSVGSAGIAVGDVVPLDDGVAVAEDPQANSSATNSNAIAFGRCLDIIDLNGDCGKYLPLFLRIAII